MSLKLELLSENVCTETIVETEINEKTNEKKLYLTGIGLQSNITNKNQRVYPESVLYEAVDKHVNEMMPLGRCAGELEHPKTNSNDINLDRISHRFTEVKKDSGNIYLKALVLDTRCGKQLTNIAEGGIVVGFSSRALGNIKTSNGQNVVQPGLKIVSLSDAVFNQSAQDAFASSIYENKEWIYQNGVLVEKDLSEELDEYKKLISETTKKDRSVVFANIITDYFKKIKF